MNPGIQLRIEQASLDNLFLALQRFIPHYLEFDMKLPNEIEFEVKAMRIVQELIHFQHRDPHFSEAIQRLDFFCA